MSIYLVTGASGGIGTAVCTRLASSGHRLILAARDADRLKSLQASLPGAGHEIATVDMASDESVEHFAQQLAARGVQLDGAVLMPPQPHAANDPLPASDVWRTLFQTSFIGPLATLKAAIAHMRPDVSAG